MKKEIIPFLLGIFVTLSIAAGATMGNLITIKPAIPKYTVVYSGPNGRNFILNKAKEGYVVDKLSTIYEWQFIVMVKY